jgi:hypothetical protein
MDYLVGTLLILAPFIFQLNLRGAESWVAIIIGCVVLLQSLFTDYELGLVKSIPLPTHLIMDLVLGVVLLISPWLFGFAQLVYVPHVVFGLLAIISGLTTESHPRQVHGRNLSD